jgi:photosystem II stability/assembly factor-like uncharacterized protein
VFSFGSAASAIPTYAVRQDANFSFRQAIKGSSFLVVSFSPVVPRPSTVTSGVIRSDLINIGTLLPRDAQVVRDVQLVDAGSRSFDFAIGLSSPTCFRVTEASNPPRLLIDFDTSQTFACTTRQGGAETGGPFELKGIGVAPAQNPSSQSFDRITFSFDSGVPAFGVIPQDSAIFSRPDGAILTLAGNAGIRVKLGNVRNTELSKIGWAMSSGSNPSKTGPLDFTPNLTAIREVAMIDNSHGTIQYGVGLASSACFRVIENDKTLEIDFQTPASVSKVPYQVRQLSFVDALRGWALGTTFKGQRSYMMLARTTDGGATWHYLPFQNPSLANATADAWHISFDNAATGWLYGNQLYVTNDGGQTWTLTTSAFGQYVIALASSGHSVWSVINPGCLGPTTCPGQLELSSDGGASWSWTHVSMVGFGAQIVRLGPATGWILEWQPGAQGGSSKLVVTHDGGATWVTLTPPCPAEDSFEDRMAALPDGTLWVICGGQPGAGQQIKQLAISSDGGQHWTYPPNQPSGGYVRELALSSPTTGWLALSRGVLEVTPDSGQSWQTADSRGVAVEVAWSGALAVMFTDSLHGWAATSTEIFRTSDGGLHWTGSLAEAVE